MCVMQGYFKCSGKVLIMILALIMILVNSYDKCVNVRLLQVFTYYDSCRLDMTSV